MQHGSLGGLSADTGHRLAQPQVAAARRLVCCHQFAFNAGFAPPDQSSKKEKEGNAEIIYFGHEEFITICRRHYRLRVRHQD